MHQKNSFTTYIISGLVLLLAACNNSKKIASDNTGANHPHAASEFRAAWIATVANINWPSKPGLSTEEQQKEAIVLLDFLRENHFNAVIFQVRPQCDALYNSSLEPWSYYLTGQQGKAPVPYYDPLEFWIKEAHDRGMELHVWLNPYRAHHKDGKEITEQSIVKTHPELVVPLKEGYWWLDPAKKGTQEHSMAVAMDIVKRYDIDGVHFDDYFYPYPSYNGNADFPDQDSWNDYLRTGGKLSRGDWRRKAVNDFIEQLYKNIKATKPYVKFGLSPFGIWRPGYPASIAGFDQYNELYADAKLWLNKGWIDYFSPQLYWPINRLQQSFPVLLGWWSKENTLQRHLWPGISLGSDTSAKNTNEILSQLMITRGMLPQSKGVVHWNAGSLMKNPGMTKAIITGPYKEQALVPASPWLDNKAPASPVVVQQLEKEQLSVSWTHADEKDVFHWVVYYKTDQAWEYTILNRNARSISFPLPPGGKIPVSIAVTAVDRCGNESLFTERATGR